MVTQTVAPELELVIAAARFALAPASAARIQPLAAAVIDWPAALSTAEAHRVVPFVARNLVAHAGGAVPADVQRAFARSVHAVAVRGLRATAELARLMRAFGDAGVTALPYKGPALAVAAYGDPGCRASADLDFVVRPSEYAAARRALLAAGYVSSKGLTLAQERVIYSAYGHAPFIRVGHRAAPFVELHWRFADPRFRWNPSVDDVLARAMPGVLGGVTMPICSTEDHLMLCLLHGTRHLWSELEWLVAVDALIRRHDPDLPLVLHRAADVGGCRAALVGLALGRDVLGTSLSEPIVTALRRDVLVSELVVTARRVLEGSAGPDADTNAFVRAFHLACLDERSDTARYLAASTLLPSPRELEVLRVPDSLTFLYYPLRLARLLTRTRSR